MSNDQIVYKEGDLIILFDLAGASVLLKQDQNIIGKIDCRIKDNTIWLDHVYISPELRGKKMGEFLIKNLLPYLKENKYQVVPICSYAKIIMNRMIPR